MNFHRINIPGPRRTVRRETPVSELLQDPNARLFAGRASATPPPRRRTTPQAGPLCRGPHATMQEPIDVTANHDRPMGDILDVVRTITRPARSDDYLHVSALIHDCMRSYALREARGGTVEAQALRLADQLTYRQGEAMAEIIVKAVASTRPVSLWGHWRCRCHQTQTETPCTKAEATALSACPYCGQVPEEYREVPMFNEEYKIVGNPDILLFLEDVNAFQGVELKSITPNDFPDLARPKPEHVIQSLFYWWLMHALGYRLTTTWSIVYLNKGHSFHGNPYKEFVVDMPSQLARLDMFLEEALALKQFRAGGILPPRVRCTTTDDNMAKKCNECQACFSPAAASTTRRTISLSGFADNGHVHEPTDAQEGSGDRQTPHPPHAYTGLTRPSRVPGAPPVPVARHRPITSVNRVRVPPPRR
jgi:hypothetical protein